MNELVAITLREDLHTPTGELRETLAEDWGAFFAVLGLQPLLVPNTLPDPAGYLAGLPVRGLILSGGGHIGDWTREPPSPPANAAAGVRRDWTEFHLLRQACARGVPVLGVCRGFQFINHCFGGGLCRDLKAAGFANHVATRHGLRLEAPPFKVAAAGEVNSFHEQGVRPNELAKGLLPWGWSDDGLVEAFNHETLPVMAVQWHPERSPGLDDLNRALLKHWLSA